MKTQQNPSYLRHQNPPFFTFLYLPIWVMYSNRIKREKEKEQNNEEGGSDDATYSDYLK